MLYLLLFYQFIVFFASALSGEVCYGKYGCFNSDPPFTRALVPLPQSPAEVGTIFHLVTKAGSVIIDDSDVTKLQASGYDGSKITTIVIHGWMESIEKSKWLNTIKTDLLNKEYGHVIIAEWKKGAAEFYTISVANTRLVGAQVAELIKFLNEQTKNSPASFHLIGFSLGAHVAGYAGRRLQQVKVGRITGLDPAGPYYGNEEVDVRLDATDAQFVDVIHADGDLLGMTTRSGHFDFYPNNGKKQRGCAGNLECDHLRAPDYYMESITSQCPFRSYRCSNWDQFTRGDCSMTCGGNSCPEMGHNAINYKALAGGAFYLYTNEQQPFCVHRYVYVTFKTGSSWLGGGRNPKVRIYGIKGDSGKIELEKRDLARRSTERFVAPIKKDLGTLTSIDVWNDLGSLLDGWKLNKVTINYADIDDCSYTASYDMWITTTLINKALVRSGSNTC